MINEVAYANKIRPERALASSTVASAVGITSSPVAAAMATLLPLVETYGYDLIDVLLITIPASIVGILVMSLVMSRHGAELEDDAEYQRRLAAGEVNRRRQPSDDRAPAVREAQRRDLPRRRRSRSACSASSRASGPDRGRGRRRRAALGHADHPDGHADRGRADRRLLRT